MIVRRERTRHLNIRNEESAGDEELPTCDVNLTTSDPGYSGATGQTTKAWIEWRVGEAYPWLIVAGHGAPPPNEICH